MLDPHKLQCCGKHVTKATTEQCREQGQPCPICLESNVESKPDPLLRDRVRAVRMYCPYKQEGCHWEGEIRHLTQHLHGHCQYALLDCPHSCGAGVTRRSLDTHLTVCPVYNRPLECEHCGLEYSHDVSHLDECPRLPVYCQYKCGTELVREEILPHLKMCPKLQPKMPRPVAPHPPDELDKPDLLDIARKMLEIRSRLPDIHKSLMDTKLAKFELEERKGRTERGGSSSPNEEKGHGEDKGHQDGESQSAEGEGQGAEGEVQSAEGDLESLQERELELTIEEELMENELLTLREELHRVHREKWQTRTSE